MTPRDIGGVVLTSILFGTIGSAAGSTAVTDEASAIAAAKKYTKAQCTAATPCTYRPRREGTQWNVWVEFTKRSRAGERPQPYSGGHVVLYFDAEGHLVRRIQGE
jgi:hypothetical protein